MSTTAAHSFADFVAIIAKLRDPNGGCPWDLKQTHESIRPYLLEEAYEVLEAIENKNDSELMQELGDLLLQVVLHAQIASDRQAFTINEVVQAVAEKMITRHPHVFGEVKVQDANEVVKNWEQIKREERAEQGSEANALSGIPKAMPALIRATRIGEKAAKANFDWDSIAGVLSKIREEIDELEEVLPKHNNLTDVSAEQLKLVQNELGDLLFALAQFGRWLGITAEDALHSSCRRFTERFAKMEELRAGPWYDLDESQLENLWQSAKRAISKG